MSTTQDYIQQNKERFLEELKDLLRIASISKILPGKCSIFSSEV